MSALSDAQAQTPGMERREDRREDRQERLVDGGIPPMSQLIDVRLRRKRISFQREIERSRQR